MTHGEWAFLGAQGGTSDAWSLDVILDSLTRLSSDSSPQPPPPSRAEAGSWGLRGTNEKDLKGEEPTPTFRASRALLRGLAALPAPRFWSQHQWSPWQHRNW